MKKLFIGLMLLGLGGYGWWYAQAAGNKGFTFQTVSVEKGSLQATISATGTIMPEELVDVGSQVAGQIKEFGRDLDHSDKPIDYGSRVEENTVLAQIDEALYKAQVDQD